MSTIRITDSVDWIGVFDPDLRVFDIIMETKRGTSYNSYLVRGEKTAIIEAVKAPFAQEYLDNVRSLIDPASIDYIILNHMEPDHTGALATLLESAPQAKVVVSKTGEQYVNNIVNRELNPLKMDDGDTIDLGGKTLRFVFAPFLHWPDTMFTYLVEEGVLFPCDVFGCHFYDPRLFNDLVDDFNGEFEYYFQTIMRPFKEKMRDALAKIKGFDIKIIAPSHGPVLRKDPWSYYERYVQWATEPLDGKRAVIAFVSAYGNTRSLAEAIAEGLRESGVMVNLVDLAAKDLNMSLLTDMVEQAQALLVGSPTINGDAVAPVWRFLASLATIRLRGKIGGAFGSYGWSGEATKMIEDRLSSLRLKVPVEAVRAKLVPSAAELEKARQFGRQIAAEIQ
ncbi:MAG: FprA family A-type flavoprotein [Chloroflexi bacterium]|nr:FprA family A-type flavoprotein [Chloroflexota bacterium]